MKIGDRVIFSSNGEWKGEIIGIGTGNFKLKVKFDDEFFDFNLGKKLPAQSVTPTKTQQVTIGTIQTTANVTSIMYLSEYDSKFVKIDLEWLREEKLKNLLDN